MDGSGSISNNDFSVMKTFMKEVLDSFVISRNNVHVGVVQYSEEPQKEFSLNEFYNDVIIKERIDRIEQLKSSTYTGKALRFVHSLFQPVHGGRKKRGVSQNLIVITDGQSHDNVEDAAVDLRSDGVHVFAVGVGLINSFDLLRIAGDAKRVFTVENFDALKTIKRTVVNELCEYKDIPTQGKQCKCFVGYITVNFYVAASSPWQKYQSYLGSNAAVLPKSSAQVTRFCNFLRLHFLQSRTIMLFAI